MTALVSAQLCCLTESQTVSPISTYRAEVCETRRRVFMGFTWCWRWGKRVLATERVSHALFTLKRVDGLTAKWLEGVTWFGKFSCARQAHRGTFIWNYTKKIQKKNTTKDRESEKELKRRDTYFQNAKIDFWLSERWRDWLPLLAVNFLTFKLVLRSCDPLA